MAIRIKCKAIVLTVIALILLFNIFFYKTENERIPPNFIDQVEVDWNDYKQLILDSRRKGFGEQGESADLTDPEEVAKNKELFKTFGMSVLISDKISVNRSVPDFRDPQCLEKRYRKHFPQVSIIITFQNEIFSVFKRCLHSLYNRTPHELIKEVILVNDCSTLDYLYKPLEEYIEENFGDLNFRILNLKTRHGTTKARKAGGLAATGEIIFMMESHIELAYNWLPPLLEPLIGHPKRVTIPVIDFIEYNKLHYYANKPSRAVFNWKLEYTLIPRLPIPKDEELEPFHNPLMNGGVFAMYKKYFEEIGPYDEGHIVYGAEHMDMSFRIWLCGGEIFEVPCSRMGHVFRNFNKFRAHGNISDFIGYNQKRVIEVWFDEYKKYVEMRQPERFSSLDVGDLSKNFEFRVAHDCKPFKYFMEVIAPDLEENFPAIVPTFVSGAVRLFNTSECWDTYNFAHGDNLHLFYCDKNLTYPRDSQHFQMSFYRDVQHVSSEKCLDSYALGLINCHHSFGNQHFRYNQTTMQIYQGTRCVEAETINKTLIMAECKDDNLKQKWEWGFVNLTALENYESIAKKIN